MITGLEFGQFKRGEQRFQSHIIAGVLGRHGLADSAHVCRMNLMKLGSNAHYVASTRSFLGLPYFI